MKPKIIYNRLPLKKEQVPLLTALLNNTLDCMQAAMRSKDIILSNEIDYNTWFIDPYVFGKNKKYKSNISYNFYLDGRVRHMLATFNYVNNELLVTVPTSIEDKPYCRTVSINIDKYY